MGRPLLLARKPDLRLIGLLSFAIIGLNVMDALATLFWIDLGIEEANPFMAYILEYDSLAFLALKTLGVGLAVFFLFRYAIRRYAIAMFGLVLLAAAYLIPLAVHVFLYAYTSIK